MADNKTKPTQSSVPAFIDALADQAQRADARTLVTLMQNVTGEEPAMWGPSIVGFGTHHYRYESGRQGDMPLVSFSPRKTATVLYRITGFGSAEALLPKLGKHKMGTGCVYVNKLSDVDQTVLKTLIAKSVEAKRRGHSSSEA